MKKSTKNNIFYWLLKCGGIGVSVLLPLWVVLEKFPLWVATHGTGRSLGAGGIIGIFVMLVIFRKTVMGYVKEKFKLSHTPPIMVWIVCLVITYALLFIIKFLYDLSLVLWMGLLGSVIGTLLTLAGETLFRGEDKK
jgi:hypothetical protein